MAISKKIVLLLLLSLILLGIGLRYPTVEHERFQTDSYFIHYLSQAIVNDHTADWTFSPLSYFGYYPVSYPTGVPFIIAELAMLTGCSVELTILIANLLFSVLFALVVFSLAREFTRRPEYVLLAVFFATTAARFVDTTYWDGSARGPAIVMISMLVFIVYRAGFTGQHMLYLPAFLIGFGSFVMHHMAVLIVVFGFAQILATLGSRYLVKIPVARKRRLPILISAVVLTTLALLVMGYFGILGTLFVSTFGSNAPQEGIARFVTLIANMGVSYTHQIGFILIIAVIGAVALLRRSFFDVKTLFPLAVLVTFIPLLGNSIYVSMLLAPYASIVAVAWLGSALRHRNAWPRLRKPLVVGFVALMAASLALPVWSVETWNAQGYTTGNTVEVGGQIFNDAEYLNYIGAGHSTISNNEGLTLQLQALSRAKLLRSGLSSVVNGDVTERDLYENLTPSQVSFPGNLYVWFQYKEEYFIDGFVMSIMRTGTPALIGANAKVVDYAHSHSNMLVVADQDWASEYVTVYGVYDSVLLGELKNATTEGRHNPLPSYLIYESSGVSMYCVQIIS